MLSHKNTPTRTYTRSFKKDEGASILGLGHGEIPVEYEAACRLCLNKTDVMTEIFSETDTIVPMTEKMKNLLGVEVYEEDRLPTLICDNCTRQLDDAYNFKKRCLASYAKLRQYLCTPSKPFAYLELQNENEGEESDINSYSQENFYSLKPLKEECTIDWDDQVPLAAIISSATPEISNNILTEPPALRHILTNVGITEDNWNQVTSDEGTKTVEEQATCEIVAEPEKRSPVKIAVTRNVKPVKITNYSSGYVCKIRQRLDNKNQLDLDNVPLSIRIRMENKQYGKRKENAAGDVTEGAADAEEARRRLVRSMHVCSVCSKAFLTPSLLARHNRIHTGEKPFKCDLCNSAFSQKEILQRHKAQVHTEVKPHKCRLCGKCYGSYSILTVHVKTAHVRYGQYKCKLCAKVFRHASGLSRHMNLHNGTYFYCKVCGKKFNDGSSVRRHVKVHTGISPFEDEGH